MTRRSLCPCSAPGTRRAGFTLIELLTVIAIILVLAGLLLNVAGSANYKSSLARAQSEIKAMETALESYKADNGAYPRILPTSTNGGAAGTSTSDTLNAQSDTDPGGTSAKVKYQGASETLYQALSGITTGTGTNLTYGGKRYIEFKSTQLADSSGTAYTSPSATTMLVDPFGIPYGYSTIQLADQANGTTPPTTDGYNPTFDLWSTAGYGTGGKTYPTGVTAANYNTLWAKNW